MNARTVLFDAARCGVLVWVDIDGSRWISGPAAAVERFGPMLAEFREDVLAIVRTCTRCGTDDVDTTLAYWSTDRLCAECMAIVVATFDRHGWPSIPAPSWRPSDPGAALIAWALRGPAAIPPGDPA